MSTAEQPKNEVENETEYDVEVWGESSENPKIVSFREENVWITWEEEDAVDVSDWR